MTTIALTSLPPLVLTPDASGLVAEIEAYLASLPAPARPVPVTAADHLRLASRYIGAFGWVQGAMWDSSGRVCLLGAQAAVLAHGYGTPATVATARVQVMEVLHATGRPASSPDEYNDRPTTRQADIHHLLDRAAARALSIGL
ncbi:hypothetical protein ACFWA9_22880 [Kitasatospora sp. NPDC059973]|uniref:DUF6197 family protein n=1 Tax=Kitasatospora sp. NPDC059973 TaxID=3347020 RepID=UPI00369E0304